MLSLDIVLRFVHKVSVVDVDRSEAVAAEVQSILASEELFDLAAIRRAGPVVGWRAAQVGAAHAGARRPPSRTGRCALLRHVRHLRTCSVRLPLLRLRGILLLAWGGVGAVGLATAHGARPCPRVGVSLLPALRVRVLRPQTGRRCGACLPCQKLFGLSMRLLPAYWRLRVADPKLPLVRRGLPYPALRYGPAGESGRVCRPSCAWSPVP